jgi:hypothetical protein
MKMKTSKLNRSWHEKNRMPTNATLEQRIRWHLQHRKHCTCRPIPEKLAETMRARGLV